MTYQHIKETHKHICNWNCVLPSHIKMTEQEYDDYAHGLQPHELPAVYYKGMIIQHDL